MHRSCSVLLLSSTYKQQLLIKKITVTHAYTNVDFFVCERYFVNKKTCI